jgi:hypothetical protein
MDCRDVIKFLDCQVNETIEKGSSKPELLQKIPLINELNTMHKITVNN